MIFSAAGRHRYAWRIVQAVAALTLCAWPLPGVDAASPKAAAPHPAATVFKPLFYDNDFAYLTKPGAESALGDALKRIDLGGDGALGVLDLGGQLRTRYHHERGMGQEAGATRFEGTDNDLALTRMRLYSNWQAAESVRIYAEGIYAEVGANSDYIPRPIDRNYGDFLNLFCDLQLVEGVAVRVGRQELLYGNQRLVSPLDWANTRRTFEGLKVMTRFDDWTVDGFYTHLVPVNAGHLDRADYHQTFYGCYASYAGFEHFTVEPYYLGYDNENPGAIDADFSLHTCGVRINGGMDQWLWELEGGPQFGRQSGLGLDQDAGFCTAGLGRKLGDVLPWSPTLWCYYDYASGNAGGGNFNRFNDLFPLGHKYLGFIDAVKRQNVEAPNVMFTMAPSAKLNVLVWYWHLMANQAGDIVPSIGGTPPQSTTSTDFGDELDLLATYVLGPRANVTLGWSHFWRGNKILAPKDADFVYTAWEQNF